MSWGTYSQRLTDAVLTLAVLLYAVLERWLSEGDGWATFALAVALSAGPVAVRSRWPVPAALASTAGLALAGLVGGGLDESFSPLLGPVLTGYAVGRAATPVGIVGTVLGGTCLLLAALAFPAPVSVEDVVLSTACVLVATGVGVASREMQLETDALRAQRETDVRDAAEQERLRIARELHDVLGHTVSVMGIQAAAVRRRLLPEQQVEREALESVESAGRQAVGELRHLLGLLRAPDAPPEAGALGSSSRLLAVAEDLRRAGVPVQVRGAELVDGLSPTVALTVVRVVQEGLTNVLRHAPGASACVLVEQARGTVRVIVSDDGPGAGHGEPGFGLVGLRERVSVFGGTLSAGPAREGGFRLEAELPREAS
jgi:signal transduction histidine kinase